MSLFEFVEPRGEEVEARRTTSTTTAASTHPMEHRRSHTWSESAQGECTSGDEKKRNPREYRIAVSHVACGIEVCADDVVVVVVSLGVDELSLNDINVAA